MSVRIRSSLSPSLSPFGHRHGRPPATSDTTANSSISRRAPGSPRPRPAVRAVTVGHRRSTSAIPGPVSRATTRTPRPRLVHELHDDLAALGESDDVTGDLGDGGGDQGQLGPRETGPCRQLASTPAGRRRCRRRCGSGRASHRPDSGPAASAARSAERTGRTPGDAGRHRPPAGDGGPRWTAPATPAGTAPSAARPRSNASRYSTRSRARVRFSCAATAPAVEPELAPPGLVCPARRPREPAGSALPLGQATQRLGDGLPLLAQRARSSSGGSGGQLDHAVLVPAVTVRSRHIDGDHVARRHDRVRLEHPRLDPSAAPRAPAPGSPARGRRRRDGCAHAREHDAPNHRHQRGDVPRRVVPCSGVLNGLSAHT